MNIKQFENIMLKDLFESSNGLYAFTFYSRYRIEPKLMFKFIDKYVAKKIITYDDNDKLELTNLGKDLIYKEINDNKTIKNSNEYNYGGENIYQKKIQINAPYLPKLNYLSDEILNM